MIVVSNSSVHDTGLQVVAELLLLYELGHDRHSNMSSVIGRYTAKRIIGQLTRALRRQPSKSRINEALCHFMNNIANIRVQRSRRNDTAYGQEIQHFKFHGIDRCHDIMLRQAISRRIEAFFLHRADYFTGFFCITAYAEDANKMKRRDGTQFSARNHDKVDKLGHSFYRLFDNQVQISHAIAMGMGLFQRRRRRRKECRKTTQYDFSRLRQQASNIYNDIGDAKGRAVGFVLFRRRHARRRIIFRLFTNGNFNRTFILARFSRAAGVTFTGRF